VGYKSEKIVKVQIVGPTTITHIIRLQNYKSGGTCESLSVSP